MSELENVPEKGNFERESIGLGTFPFSGVFSDVDQCEAERIVDRFLEAGGRYIETAPIYPRTSVSLKDILARYPRESFQVGTKCVLAQGPDGKPAPSGRPTAIRAQVEDEARRLGVDYLDVVATHITPPDVEPAVAVGELENLRTAGLVRHIGVSNSTLDDLKSYVDGARIELVQNRYSVIHRSEVDYLKGFCAGHGIYMNPYQVIERGQLIDRSRERRDGDLRESKSEYIGDADDRIRSWVTGELAPIAESAGLTLKGLVVRWSLSNDVVTLPVIGATTAAQLDETMKIALRPLPSDTYEAVESAFSRLEAQIRELFGVTVPEFRGLG